MMCVICGRSKDPEEVVQYEGRDNETWEECYECIDPGRSEQDSATGKVAE